MLAPWYVVYSLYAAAFAFTGWIAYLENKRLKEHEQRIIKLSDKRNGDDY